MNNHPTLLSVPPANSHEEKTLQTMSTEDFRPFLPSHEPIVKWYDLLPLLHLAAQLLGLLAVSFLLKKEIVMVSFAYLAASAPLLIFAIRKVSELERLVFQLQLVLPHKTSYTSVIVNPQLIPNYRHWLRIQISLIEAYGVIVVASVFI